MNRVFLAIIGILMLVSCKQSGPTNEPAKNETGKTEKQVEERIRKPLSFSGTFYQITVIGSPDIIFTEGDYSIEAEGPSNIVNFVNINVDSHVLTVNMKNEDTIGTNQFAHGPSPITLYISCPSLQLLAVCGTGSFKSVGAIHTPDMQVGVLGTGNIELDSVITAGTFRYDSSGDGNALFHHIQAQQDCNLLLSGKGNLNADVDIAGNLLIENDNCGNVVVSGKAHTADLSILEESNCTAEFDADQLELTALYGNVTLKGKYRQKDIHQGRNAKIAYK